MPKYGTSKYKTFKYGRYLAVKPAVEKTSKYRLRANGGSNIVMQKTSLDGEFTRVRIRSGDSPFIVNQSIIISDLRTKVRIRTDSSVWVVFTKILLESEE